MPTTASGAPLGCRRTRRPAGERGAVAVELALLMPVVLLIVVGMLRFGVAYNTKIEMSGAAREAARWMVLHPTDQANAKQKAIDSAVTVSPSLAPAEITISNNCSLGSSVTVTIRRSVPMGIPFGPTADLPVTGSGNMQC